ncbi:hypothetical protein cyc_03116 [Cyclospora cayetanensis]|uniref:Uncharacterized protein n=1 Tax=Cyclospora cayetanensis TaxID=88456 RepID=A0A1D3CZ23_9EIME|nr:hypothetical protein cyc_03116 [Cyclospora cayetanensis]
MAVGVHVPACVGSNCPLEGAVGSLRGSDSNGEKQSMKRIRGRGGKLGRRKRPEPARRQTQRQPQQQEGGEEEATSEEQHQRKATLQQEELLREQEKPLPTQNTIEKPQASNSFTRKTSKIQCRASRPWQQQWENEHSRAVLSDIQLQLRCLQSLRFLHPEALAAAAPALLLHPKGSSMQKADEEQVLLRTPVMLIGRGAYDTSTFQARGCWVLTNFSRRPIFVADAFASGGEQRLLQQREAASPGEGTRLGGYSLELENPRCLLPWRLRNEQSHAYQPEFELGNSGQGGSLPRDKATALGTNCSAAGCCYKSSSCVLGPRAVLQLSKSVQLIWRLPIPIATQSAVALKGYVSGLASGKYRQKQQRKGQQYELQLRQQQLQQALELDGMNRELRQHLERRKQEQAEAPHQGSKKKLQRKRQ